MPRVNLLFILTTPCWRHLKRTVLLAAAVLLVAMLMLHQRAMTRSRSSVHQSQSSGDRDKTGRFALGSDTENVSDDEEVSRWYKGSACSELSHVFVGSAPLFPPCRPDIPSGVPNWGRHPYVGPLKLLNSSKNPCWLQQDGRLRCLPYFYLIGVSKSGTSDLRVRLGLHPQVKPSLKEPHWFDKRHFNPDRKLVVLVSGLG